MFTVSNCVMTGISTLVSGCQCDSVGSRQNVCDVTTGECKCEANFAGSNCDRCADGYYNFPACTCMSSLIYPLFVRVSMSTLSLNS